MQCPALHSQPTLRIHKQDYFNNVYLTNLLHLPYCTVHFNLRMNETVFQQFLCLTFFPPFSTRFCRKFTSSGGCTVIAIYIIYTMLPIRLREAIVGGTLLSLSHVLLTFFMNDSDDDHEVVSVALHKNRPRPLWSASLGGCVQIFPSQGSRARFMKRVNSTYSEKGSSHQACFDRVNELCMCGMSILTNELLDLLEVVQTDVLAFRGCEYLKFSQPCNLSRFAFIAVLVELWAPGGKYLTL